MDSQGELDSLLKGALRLAPKLSVQAKRQPCTIQYLQTIQSRLNLQSPLDAAAWVVLTIAFFSLTRLGELLVTRLDGFTPGEHISPCHIRQDTDREGRHVWVIRTKSAPSGEDLSSGKIEIAK